MKVLLILDDVTELEHLQMLAGDRGWFGPGSRIIVTTRDQDLLIAHGIELRYEMEELSHDKALELLCWHAFKNGTPKMNFEELAKQAAWHAEGLPLALEVIGCNLYDKKANEWTCMLDKYEKIPDGKIQRKLRISYDDLDRNEKQIFLDLACFFKGEELNYVENVLDACGLYPKHGIGRLVSKSLIKIKGNIVNMHDLIQKMGREIIQARSSDPSKWSRLWFHEDVLKVLTTNTGTKKIEGIMLDLPQREEVQWSGNAFEKMPNLRILIVRKALFSRGPTHLPNTLRLLDWTEYPSTSLPEDFHPRKLVALNLPNSRLRLDAPLPELKQLTRINFTACQQLTEIPDMSTVPNLTVLQLDACDNLVKIHDSVGFLGKLTNLRAENCTMLEKLPSEIILPSLEYLSLYNCSRLQKLPNVLDKMENISAIVISRTAVQELPSSMGNLIGLTELHASDCSSLTNLNGCMGMLTNLACVTMGNCPQLCLNCKSHCDAGKVTSSFAKLLLDLSQSHLSDNDLPVIVGCFPGIRELILSRNNFINISACLKELSHLKILRLDDCEQLQEIQGVPPNLATTSAGNCKALNTQSALEVFLDVKIEIVMPSNMVLKWGYYYYEGESMSFWVRKKFPMIDIGVSFETCAYDRFGGKLCVFLNDFSLFKAPVTIMNVKGEHSWVLHLNCYLREVWGHQNEWFEQVDEMLQEGWNHVKISWEVSANEGFADCCGVAVNREEVSMHDILFEKPDTENACGCAECREASDYFQEAVEDYVSTFSSVADDDISRDELVTDPNTLQKRPSHSSIVQRQRCVTGINHHMSENSERVAKDKGKGVMVHENQEVDSAREMLLLYPQNGPITLECVNKNSLPKNQISSACIPDKKFSASYEVVGSPNEDFGDHPTYSEKELNIRRLPNLGPEFQQKSSLEKNCINQKPSFAMAAASTKRASFAIAAASTKRARVSWETSFSEQTNPLTAVEQGGLEHGMVPVSNEPQINDIVAFYASLNEEMSDPSSPQSAGVSTELANNRRLREETKKALKILGDFLSNEFSLSMQPEQCSIMETTLNHLLTLSSDDGISPAMKSIIQQLSIEFTSWRSEYCDANEKINSSTIELSKLDKLKEDLKSNRIRFMEVSSLENDLEKRKTYLEEQINAIREEIDRAAKEKVEIFHEGRNLKVHMDELKNQSPHLKDVQESAKKTQANIEAEWSKLREQFNKNSHFDP